jgi:hypothetical protein
MKTKAHGYLVAPADHLNLSAPRISALYNPHSKAVNFAQRSAQQVLSLMLWRQFCRTVFAGIRDNTLGLRIESNARQIIGELNQLSNLVNPDTLEENPRSPRGVHIICFLTFLCAILMSNAEPSISMRAIHPCSLKRGTGLAPFWSSRA